jgi:hypothetical protein
MDGEREREEDKKRVKGRVESKWGSGAEGAVKSWGAAVASLTVQVNPRCCVGMCVCVCVCTRLCAGFDNSKRKVTTTKQTYTFFFVSFPFSEAYVYEPMSREAYCLLPHAK